LRGRPGDKRDDELMDLVSDGSVAAFERVYDTHGQAAFSLACRIVGDRARAEEVTQEAFLAIWRNGSRYDASRGSLRIWVLGIIRHRAIDALRRDRRHEQRRGPTLDTASPDSAPHLVEAPERTDAEVERRFDVRRVRDALGELPDDQRHAVELAYYGGLTQTEIAEALKVPVGTVKGRMRLGLKKLRSALEPSQGELV
jgi:RNA polymerase sigma-70 factor, ECF subfamily